MVFNIITVVSQNGVEVFTVLPDNTGMINILSSLFKTLENKEVQKVEIKGFTASAVDPTVSLPKQKEILKFEWDCTSVLTLNDAIHAAFYR